MADAPKTIVKQVKNAILYSDGTIRIDNVRASYPHIDAPYAGTDDSGNPGVPAYGVVGLMPKATHAEAKDLLVEIINGILKENKVPVLEPEKKFLRNGDVSSKETNHGNWTVSTRESRRPSVRDADRSRMTDPAKIKERFFGGVIVNILIRPWWQNHKKWGKRVNAGLSAIQFVRDDGTRFGEGVIGEEAIDDRFENVSDDNGGFDDDGMGGDGLGGPAQEDFGGL